MSASWVPSRRALLTGAVGVGALGSLALGQEGAQAQLGDPTLPTGGTGDYFLQLTGIPGDSVRDGHEGEIELLTFGWGATQLESIKVGKDNSLPEPFLLAAYTGSHSSGLFEHLVSGQQIANAELTLRRTVEGETSDYARLAMQNCLVSSYRATPHPADGRSMDVAELLLSARPTWTVDAG